ncbi:pyridoxamine 5'-phosphate oxidase [Alkalilimnicola sp. S0819]|uniref:pyridoxamine 5'-phosphate oxidase n=1 Tax=Alkalilimnicola sp. S0819 TaxID=2613922 RepID=UPI001261C597|nr:pyridoxamine 5'-phosphate oxidase [Alkalilimnicola sp. S0819]KAB7628409.1 pyridoxamine 5'-phosphate oxidase [Alkalilimnicola sp. S0819]MPQ15312.1 pyridoxamine 5'-phosphate oxidase [Alkalilimnicola sp. S0819]
MQVDPEALSRIQELLAQAGELDLNEPTAMTLATAGADGRPTARIVLLKQADERGFVFYTNSRSRKGRNLAENPWAALCLFWQPLMRQVLIEGRVEPVSEAESDAYWAHRPRSSQIGAWASEQSEPLADRETLERRTAEFEQRFAGVAVPRPPHWGGYLLRPELIEFWVSRPGRLHERQRYTLVDGAWQQSLVYP